MDAMKNNIYLTNSLSGEKETFKSLQDDRVLMYVCGVTPYDHAHLGHGRCYITFDLLNRLLRFVGYDVSYCRNFTDIDDKILRKAQAELGDEARYQEISQRYIASYHEDMDKLNCLSPQYEPRVTESIEQIITFISKLIESGHAYAVDGDVYFRITSFAEYGKLSKQKLIDLRAGERVEVNDKKEDPLDFALWKSEEEGTFWKSPWGYGRPGWHIECSVMAFEYLGKHLDIHAGGLDLMFPHHENEIAQSESLLGAPFAHYWVHNGFVQINKEKMSKSLGNFFTLKDIFKTFDPMVVRYYMLTHHYRSPLDFSHDDMKSVQKSYQRLCQFFANIQRADTVSHADLYADPISNRMLQFLLDDMNTPGMLGVLFESLPLLQQDAVAVARVKYLITLVLGLTLEPLTEASVEITPEMQQLITQREEARAQRDWARADAIRDQLTALGYEVKDKKTT